MASAIAALHWQHIERHMTPSDSESNIPQPDGNEPRIAASEVTKHEDAYRRRRSEFEEFTSKLTDLVRELLRRAGIDVVQVESRTKSAESFSEKIQRKGLLDLDPLAVLTDLVGIRIITYYLEDVEKVGEIIKREFAVDMANSVDKAEVLDADQFGYTSVHYIVRLGGHRRELAEWRPFVEIPAEIQVRTALQHAWAAVDHKLRYKAEVDVPPELKRQLSRLSALFELADEQFSELRVASERLSADYRRAVSEGSLGIALNLASLREYVTGTHRIADIRKAAIDAGWRVLDASQKSRDSAQVRLLYAANAVEIETIEELDHLLTKALKSPFLEHFKHFRGLPEEIAALMVLEQKNAMKKQIDLVFRQRSVWEAFKAYRATRRA